MQKQLIYYCITDKHDYCFGQHTWQSDNTAGMRMLSPDNYVQDPNNPNNYNRYAYCMNNPLKYTDPSGESLLLAGIASFIFTGGIEMLKGWEGWSGSGIPTVMSFASAMLGGYVANTLSQSIGTIGFLGGAKVYGFSGAAAGFVNNTGVSLLRGNSIEGSLMMGISGGIFGGTAGALIGGTYGGMSAIKNGGDFWTGKGAHASIPYLPANGENKPLDYSEETVSEFANNYVFETEGNKNYILNEIPQGYEKIGGKVYELEKTKWGKQLLAVNGATSYTGRGQWDVYLFEAAFQSKEHLYITMGHENIHVGLDNMLFRQNLNKQEASCRLWNYHQGKAWNWRVKTLRELYYSAIGDQPFPKMYHYKRLGVPILNNRPW